MSLLPIHLLGSPVLREASAPVAEVTEEVRRLVDDMFETMDAAEGVGLAANQIGQAIRVAVVDAEGDPHRVDQPRHPRGVRQGAARKKAASRSPRCTPRSPGRSGWCSRPSAGTARPTGSRPRGLLARAIQHEIDHLDGILFLDRLSPLKRRLLVAKYRREYKESDSLLREVARPSGRTP